MTYSAQTWTNGSGGGTPLSAARMTHIEDGMVALDTGKAALAGATFTGNISAPNVTGILALAVGAAVPGGTPVGTVIVRY